MNIWDFQTRLTRRLLIWAAGSVLVSALAVFAADPFWRGVAIQFFVWGVIDAAIAVFGAWLSSRKQRSIQESERVEVETKEARWLRRLLWINTALDVFYILGGLWLMQTWGANDPLWRGHGWGILAQGAFLFVFDFHHAFVLREHGLRRDLY